MASFTLACTDVHFELVLIENAEGQPLTSTDTLAGSCADPTVFAVTLDVMPSGPNQGKPARKIVPLRQPRAGDVPLACTVSDTTNTGVASWVDTVTLGPDTVETQIVGDPNNVVLVPQALPPA